MPTIYIVLDVGLQHFHGKIVTSFRFPPLTQGGSLLMDQMVSTHTLTPPSHPHTLTGQSSCSDVASLSQDISFSVSQHTMELTLVVEVM